MPFECDDVPVLLSLDGNYTTTAPVGYRGRDERFEIDAGFVTDLASVPRWLSALAPIAGLVALAALLHDWLLRLHRIAYERGQPQRLSSEDIDGLFRRCLREAWYRDPRTGRIRRINRVRREVYWLGVRWGALFSAYRRAGWWRPGHAARVLTSSLLLLPVLVPYALVSGYVFGLAWIGGRALGWLWPDPLPADAAGGPCQPVMDPHGVRRGRRR